MFLKNYIALLCTQTGFKYSPNVPITTWGGTKSESFVDGSYSTYTASLITALTTPIDASSNIKNGINSSGNVPNGVIFGTGTTPPSLDDYCFSGTAIDNLTTSNVTLVRTNECTENNSKISMEYTISNTTGADITIGEIGLLIPISAKKTGSNSTYYYSLLIERSVLDSPVTILAGGVGRVIYTLQMNFPF
jgi:hypothetical protein